MQTCHWTIYFALRKVRQQNHKHTHTHIHGSFTVKDQESCTVVFRRRGADNHLAFTCRISRSFPPSHQRSCIHSCITLRTLDKYSHTPVRAETPAACPDLTEHGVRRDALLSLFHSHQHSFLLPAGSDYHNLGSQGQNNSSSAYTSTVSCDRVTIST